MSPASATPQQLLGREQPLINSALAQSLVIERTADDLRWYYTRLCRTVPSWIRSQYYPGKLRRLPNVSKSLILNPPSIGNGRVEWS